MSGLVEAAHNLELSAFATAAALASLHTADPGASGAFEVTGGTPPYSRQPLSWSTPASSSIATTADLTFAVPATTTVTHVGYWTSSGVFLGSRPLDLAQAFTSQGTLILDAGALVEARNG